MSVIPRSFTIMGGGNSSGGTWLGLNGQTIVGNSSGAWAITANGTNQNITLTPSGTGRVLSLDGTVGRPTYSFTSDTDTGIYTRSTNRLTLVTGGANRVEVTDAGNLLLGGLTTDGTGVLQFPTATTSAGGITFGTTMNFYASATNSLSFNATGTNTVLILQEGGTTKSQWSSFGGDAFFDTVTAGKSITFRSGNQTTALTLDSSQNNQMAGKTTSYNGIATVGNGVVTVQGAGRVTAQTAAVASISTYTVGAADASFHVSVNVNVTTSTTHNFSITVTYTDEGNTSRTVTMAFAQLTASTLITAITNITGAGPYESFPLHIRCKASTAITVASTGTFTSVVYNAEGIINKVA